MNQPIPIVCPYCGVGCNLELTLDEKGTPVSGRASGRNQELNQKYLCAKGLVIPEMINHKDRLLYPAIRQDRGLQRVSWDDALSESAQRLKNIVSQYGPESVGMLASSKVLNEEVYLCQKFHRQVIGNNNIDNCARLCHGPSEASNSATARSAFFSKTTMSSKRFFWWAPIRPSPIPLSGNVSVKT